jgi:hypothetical protein
MDEMNNPVESDGVFTYNVGFNFTIENFVLCDGDPLTLARWPNKTSTKLLDPEAAIIVNKGSFPTGIVNLNFPLNFNSESLKGTAVWANAESKWNCWTSNVVGFDSISKIILLKGFGDSWWVKERHNPKRAHRHYGNGIFYVAGAEVLLGAPGEWFFKKENHQLKLNFPKGKDATTSVISVNKRKWTIDFRNCSFIEVDGLDTVGAPITFQNASSCIVKNGVIKYFYYSFGNNSIMGITKNSGILLSGVKKSIESTIIINIEGKQSIFIRSLYKNKRANTNSI